MEGWPEKKKPFIRQRNSEVRMEFAESHLQKGSKFWKRDLFVDESKYNVFGRDGHNYVWRKPREEFSFTGQICWW